jgi:hypothetical protein
MNDGVAGASSSETDGRADPGAREIAARATAWFRRGPIPVHILAAWLIFQGVGQLGGFATGVYIQLVWVGAYSPVWPIVIVLHSAFLIWAGLSVLQMRRRAVYLVGAILIGTAAADVLTGYAVVKAASLIEAALATAYCIYLWRRGALI